MNISKYNLSDINSSKWNELVKNQKGHVPFYDWASIETLCDLKYKSDGIAIILETDGNYLLAVPGFVINNVFHNLYFQTFDNLDVITHKEANVENLNSFINYFRKNFCGLVLKNFNSESILHKTYKFFIDEPLRKCPYLNLPENTEQLFKMINRSFKKTLRWNINGLEKAGVSTRIITSSESFGKLYEQFLQLHSERMLEKNMKSQFPGDNIQKFFRKLNAHPNSNTILTVAFQNETFIGAIYGIKTENTYAYIASGIKSDIEKFSIGQLLIFRTMEYLLQQKPIRFDFLRGKESYKLLWTKSATINNSRYYYKINSLYIVFRMFLKENKNRFGRAMCIKMMFTSLFSGKLTSAN